MALGENKHEKGCEAMSKVSNALKMYMLLQSRGMMKVGEIAKELGVTPRMIKSYKNDLEEAHIYIGSVRGRYGGYYLESRMSLRGLSITRQELDALKKANQVIKNRNDYYTSDFETLTSKILNEKNDFQETSYYSKGVASIVMENEKQVWRDINQAIEKKKKIKIKYASIGDKEQDVQERIIHPYGLCDHKGAAYFYGYCELRKEGRMFKLVRVMSHETLKDNFMINPRLNFKETIKNSFGIYNDPPISLVLKIDYPMSQIVKEKIYSSNQKIEDIEDQAIIFKARMGGYTEIKGWVMGMGSLVEVIKPLKLKEDVRSEAIKVLELYGEKQKT